MRLAPLLALLVVLTGCVPGFAAATGPTAAHGPTTPSPSGADVVGQATPVEEGTEVTTFRVLLRADGDAEWTVVTRIPLATENETRAFRSLARDYENGEGERTLGIALFERAVTEANAATDREMALTNVSREATVTNDTGRLTLEFTWSNFLERTGSDTLRFDDALRTRGGTWFESLEADQRLEVVTPPGYSIDTNPGFPYRNDTVIVDGPARFGGERELVLEYQEIQNTGPGEQGPPWDLVVGAGAAVVAVVALLIAVVYFRRRDDEPVPTDGGGAVEPPADGDAPRPNSDGGTETAPPTDPTADEPADPEPADEEEAADVDLGLLSDEERVEYLLEQNGGRMKQASIVKETGWSDAKVSQLLSTMADDGRVDKLRLGRENLISLPDDEDD